MAVADGIASFLTRVNLCIELNQQDDPEGTLGMSFKDKIPVQKIVGLKSDHPPNRRSPEIQGTALGKCLQAWTCIYI